MQTGADSEHTQSSSNINCDDPPRSTPDRSALHVDYFHFYFIVLFICLVIVTLIVTPQIEFGAIHHC